MDFSFSFCFAKRKGAEESNKKGILFAFSVASTVSGSGRAWKCTEQNQKEGGKGGTGNFGFSKPGFWFLFPVFRGCLEGCSEGKGMGDLGILHCGDFMVFVIFSLSFSPPHMQTLPLMALL